MKINGHTIKSLLKVEEIELSLLQDQFSGSETRLNTEVLPDEEAPQAISEKILMSESKLAHLQALQTYYNLAVRVHHNGKDITLAEAIKTLGGMTRVAARWTKLQAVGERVQKRAPRRYREEDPNQPHEVITTTLDIKKARSIKLTKDILALKGLIGKANSVDIDTPEWYIA